MTDVGEALVTFKRFVEENPYTGTAEQVVTLSIGLAEAGIRLDASTFALYKQFEGMVAFTGEDERWGKHFVPYSLRHFYASIRLQHGTTRSALCENMGVTEPYLRKHYSHYLTRLATADLMKMDKEMGLGGKLIPEGEDFVVPDVT